MLHLLKIEPNLPPTVVEFHHQIQESLHNAYDRKLRTPRYRRNYGKRLFVLPMHNQINSAVLTKYNADMVIANSTRCAREQAAFDAMNAADPDFLELDEADWKPLYGCP